MFPSANTAIPQLTGMPAWVNEKHDKFSDPFIRVDLFALKDGSTIDSPLIAPLRPDVPALVPGRTYMLDAVIRTLKLGHVFPQGTADSNEIWLDVRITSSGRVIARSGGMSEADGEVDPWSHFVNLYMLDREGNRIDRRNPQNIFTPLYNNQIPPGAADTVHYVFTVPKDVTEPITAQVELKYRKFDTTYMRYFEGDKFVRNDLPISVLARDSVTFGLQSADGTPITTATQFVNADSNIEPWQRWNDYGIGLFRKGEGAATMSKGELKQAEFAFSQVEKLGRADGPLNRARVYVKEGRLEDAVQALNLASEHSPPASPWSVAWFTGLVNKQNGNLDDAIDNFRSILAMKDTEECRKREFDFTQDYNLQAELGQTLFERAKQERGPERAEQRQALLCEAVQCFDDVLALDSENLSAHYNLALIYAQLGDQAKAEKHHEQHVKYKPDDNARDHAVSVARMNNPAANHAAEAIVIFDMQRPGTYGMSSTALAAFAEDVDSAKDARHD
jgi:tetratricopeptide (TPR) repeat protein